MCCPKIEWRRSAELIVGAMVEGRSKDFASLARARGLGIDISRDYWEPMGTLFVPWQSMVVDLRSTDACAGGQQWLNYCKSFAQVCIAAPKGLRTSECQDTSAGGSKASPTAGATLCLRYY